MSATAEFRPGLVFPEWECAVTPEQQAEKLACCGIDPALHGGRVDITQLAYAAVLSARRAGISINGRVHMSQAFDLAGPVMLGEPLRVRGEVVAVTPDRRGAIEESRFDFLRPDGSIRSRRGAARSCSTPTSGPTARAAALLARRRTRARARPCSPATGWRRRRSRPTA